MIDFQNQISSETAKKVLSEAKKNGVTVEIYLKKIAEKETDYKLFSSIRRAKIKYNSAKSQKWVADNYQKYLGKWIVLDGNKLIGFGDNPLPIVQKARKEGVKIPFVKFIADNSEPFMGGWL
jgi:Family of unknown function (DUF5678)